MPPFWADPTTWTIIWFGVSAIAVIVIAELDHQREIRKDKK